MEWFWSVVPYPFPAAEGAQAVAMPSTDKKVEEYGSVDSQTQGFGVPGYDHGVKEAEKLNESKNASKPKMSIRMSSEKDTS